MASVLDVAAFILQESGEMTAMKLQKLAYYSQAWSLVWDEAPLFDEDFQAWANGPVSPVLYQKHKGSFSVSEISGGNPGALTEKQKETVLAVLNFYGKHTGAELSQLTHREAPWVDARQGAAPGERSSAPITHAAMAEYYGSLG